MSNITKKTIPDKLKQQMVGDTLNIPKGQEEEFIRCMAESYGSGVGIIYMQGVTPEQVCSTLGVKAVELPNDHIMGVSAVSGKSFAYYCPSRKDCVRLQWETPKPPKTERRKNRLVDMIKALDNGEQLELVGESDTQADSDRIIEQAPAKVVHNCGDDPGIVVGKVSYVGWEEDYRKDLEEYNVGRVGHEGEQVELCRHTDERGHTAIIRIPHGRYAALHPNAMKQARELNKPSSDRFHHCDGDPTNFGTMRYVRAHNVPGEWRHKDFPGSKGVGEENVLKVISQIMPDELKSEDLASSDEAAKGRVSKSVVKTAGAREGEWQVSNCRSAREGNNSPGGYTPSGKEAVLLSDCDITVRALITGYTNNYNVRGDIFCGYQLDPDIILSVARPDGRRLAFEIDGSSHNARIRNNAKGDCLSNDYYRSQALYRVGWDIIRIKTADAVHTLKGYRTIRLRGDGVELTASDHEAELLRSAIWDWYNGAPSDVCYDIPSVDLVQLPLRDRFARLLPKTDIPSIDVLQAVGAMGNSISIPSNIVPEPEPVEIEELLRDGDVLFPADEDVAIFGDGGSYDIPSSLVNIMNSVMEAIVDADVDAPPRERKPAKKTPRDDVAPRAPFTLKLASKGV